jgi:hypothetical protein
MAIILQSLSVASRSSFIASRKLARLYLCNERIEVLLEFSQLVLGQFTRGMAMS